MVESTTHITFDTAKERAAHVIAKMIAGTPMEFSGEGSKFINAPEVTISTSLGRSDESKYGDTPNMEVVHFEFSNVGEHMGAANVVIRNVMEKLPALASHIQFGDADKEANDTRGIIAELIDKGADIPKELLKWPEFSHENNENKSSWNTAKYTTYTQTDGHGVTINFNLPEHLNAGMTMNDLKLKFEARKDQILDVYADRLAKYKNVRGNKEEEAKIREALKGLEFEVHSTGERIQGEESRTGTLFITLRTPAQKAAKELHDKDHLKDPVEANPELESGNILQTIKPAELAKASARAVLTGDMETTVAIIGAKDVYNMLQKQLTKFKAEKPEFAEKADEVLASTMFKDSAYDTPQKKLHEVKQPLVYDLENTEGKIKIALALPKDYASKFIREVAAMAGPDVTASEVAAAPAEAQKFASVDSMELVGVHTKNPEVNKLAQEAAAPLVGQQISPEHANSFAEKIVKLIEEAHHQVQEGKKALGGIAKKEDEKFEQILAADLGEKVAEQAAPDTKVTPASIMANRNQQLDLHNLNWKEKLAALTSPSAGMSMGA